MAVALLWFTLQDPADLIAKLGHDDPDVRETATAALIAMGKPAAKIVEPYLRSDDPEVSARARMIVDAVEPPSPPSDLNDLSGLRESSFGIQGNTLEYYDLRRQQFAVFHRPRFLVQENARTEQIALRREIFNNFRDGAGFTGVSNGRLMQVAPKRR